MILDFLKKVLPEGLIVIARPATKGFLQKVCTTFEEAVVHAEKFDAQGKDCYFGLGSLLAPFKKREKDGKEEVRVSANINSLKCLFLDLDVEAGNPKKYETQADAIVALKIFCKDEAFPAPMLVNSGGGIHAYWPFQTPISAYEWREMAQTFKAALAEYGLKADPTRTADSSSVLRVVGTHNYKGGMKRSVVLLKNVEPYPLEEIRIAVKGLGERYKIAPIIRVPKADTPTSILGSNTEKTPETEVEIASVQARLNATPADCDYEQWRNIIWGLAALEWGCGLDMAIAWSKTSKGPKRHDVNYVQTLYDKYDVSGGITARSLFHHTTEPAPTPTSVIVVDPVTGITTEITERKAPWPYAVGHKGQMLLTLKDKEPEIVCPYEIRAVRRTRNERDNTDSVTWEVRYEQAGPWREFSMKQSLLARPEVLHAALYDISIVVGAAQIKLMVPFMNAYIKQLQADAEIEQLFSRMGWREENTKFVLGDMLYERSGESTQHRLSEEVKSEIRGLGPRGDLENWKQTIQFFNSPGHEAHRFILYCGFGAPLLHLTGHKGVIVNGSGDSGAGKTTAIKAAASIFGHPVDFLINGTDGGTTENALYAKLGAYNNLPFPLDEITLIDPKILGKFAMNVNQGVGKIRLMRSGGINQTILTWATIVLSSANTDIYGTLSQSRADAGAEAMRVLQIPFVMPKSHTKAEADRFLRELQEHHGTAGHLYIQYITQEYEAVKARVIAAVEVIDRMANISTAERFWSGVIASAMAGGLAARRLGLLANFPIEQDITWVIKKLSTSRKEMVDHIASPCEVISEFMETRVGETLTVSQTLKANIAPRVDQSPRGSLCIRHEVDAGIVYIMRSEFRRYCTETGANYGAIQKDLVDRQALLDHNRQVVLGKGTDLGKGQVRCWVVDLSKIQEGN
jgi:hypothetical protein